MLQLIASASPDSWLSRSSVSWQSAEVHVSVLTSMHVAVWPSCVYSGESIFGNTVIVANIPHMHITISNFGIVHEGIMVKKQF